TRIAGHSDAIAHGLSGLLVDGRDEFVGALDRVLRDTELRDRLSRGAIEHASRFTWAATARGALEVLAADALRRRGRLGPPGPDGRRRPRPRRRRHRPRPRAGGAYSGTRSSRRSRTSRPCARRRARSPPTPSSTCTWTRRGSSSGRPPCGTRTSGSARSPTRTSATSSRWG